MIIDSINGRHNLIKKCVSCSGGELDGAPCEELSFYICSTNTR